MKPIIDLQAIIQIESSGNPKAFNEKSGARGLCQITPVCLEEFNRFHERVDFPEEATKIRIDQLFDPRLNRLIADWYLNTRIPSMLEAYAIPVTVDNILIAYNWGIGNLSKLFRNERHKSIPEETVNYLKKYKELVK